MTKLSRNTHAGMHDAAHDLVSLAMAEYPQMLTTDKEELLMFAYGALYRIAAYPPDEHAEIYKDFEAVAVEVGKALAGGATVEDALTRETPFCLEA